MITLSQLDRSIFEALRKTAVQVGMLPDKTLYGTLAEWRAARVALQAAYEGDSSSETPLVDVYGVGNTEERGEKKACLITLERLGASPGSVGLGDSAWFEQYVDGGATKWRKLAKPDTSLDFMYEVRLFGRLIKEIRAMEALVWTALGTLKAIPVYDVNGVVVPDEYIQLEYNGTVSVPAFDAGETIIRYQALDVFLAPLSKYLEQNIAPINTINLDVSVLRQEETEPSAPTHLVYTASDQLILEYDFDEDDTVLPFEVPSNLNGEVTAQVFTDNVASIVSLTLNTVPVSLPVTLAPGDVLELTITKTNPGARALVRYIGVTNG